MKRGASTGDSPQTHWHPSTQYKNPGLTLTLPPQRFRVSWVHHGATEFRKRFQECEKCLTAGLSDVPLGPIRRFFATFLTLASASAVKTARASFSPKYHESNFLPGVPVPFVHGAKKSDALL